MKTVRLLSKLEIIKFCEVNGASQVWKSWRDEMIAQGREVSPERMDWGSLPARDKFLDAMIANAVITDFLAYIRTHDENGEHIAE